MDVGGQTGISPDLFRGERSANHGTRMTVAGQKSKVKCTIAPASTGRPQPRLSAWHHTHTPSHHPDWPFSNRFNLPFPPHLPTPLPLPKMMRLSRAIPRPKAASLAARSTRSYVVSSQTHRAQEAQVSRPANLCRMLGCYIERSTCLGWPRARVFKRTSTDSLELRPAQGLPRH